MNDQEPARRSPRYQVVTKLGHGGMARVHLVLSRGQAGVSKLLVSKELHPILQEDADIREMFLDEARLSVRLNHPNVVQTYEVDTSGDCPVIIMEYLEGQPLSAVIQRMGRGEMPMDLHLYILTQVLAGLHYAHEVCDHDGTPLCVVHRDVSPQNVFLTYDGEVKLVDFGIAKAAGSNRRTQTGVFKGKITYAAPEQVSGQKVDRRCDIFSLGVMLWEALARRRLVGPDLDIVVMQQRAAGAEPRIETVAPETAPELVRICNKAMALLPEDRYGTAEELRLALVAQLDRSAPSGQQHLAELMRTSFAGDRSGIRKVIAARVKELSAEETPPGTAAGPPSLRSPSSRQLLPAPPAAGPPLRVATSAATASLLPDDPTDPEGSTAKVASLNPPLPRSGLGLRGGLLLGALLVAAVAFTIVQLSRPQGDVSGSAPSSQTVTVAEAPPPPPATATPTVEVSLAVDPPEARVYVDDLELATNPFRGALPRSAMARRVRASALGFMTEERLLVFDRDVHLQLQLRPVTDAAASPATSRRPGAAPTASATATSTAAAGTASSRPGDPLPGTTTKQPRQIDSTF